MTNKYKVIEMLHQSILELCKVTIPSQEAFHVDGILCITFSSNDELVVKVHQTLGGSQSQHIEQVSPKLDSGYDVEASSLMLYLDEAQKAAGDASIPPLSTFHAEGEAVVTTNSVGSAVTDVKQLQDKMGDTTLSQDDCEELNTASENAKAVDSGESMEVDGKVNDSNQNDLPSDDEAHESLLLDISDPDDQSDAADEESLLKLKELQSQGDGAANQSEQSSDQGKAESVVLDEETPAAIVAATINDILNSTMRALGDPILEEQTGDAAANKSTDGPLAQVNTVNSSPTVTSVSSVLAGIRSKSALWPGLSSVDPNLSPNKSDSAASTSSPKLHCSECNVSLPSAEALKEHNESFHGLLTCAVCQSTYKHKVNYDLHILTHKAAIPSTSGTASSSIRDRASPMTTKNYQRQLKCGICGFMTCQVNNLVEHFKRSHEYGTFLSCLLCAEFFPNDHTFGIHRKIAHADISENKCSVCSHGFKSHEIVRHRFECGKTFMKPVLIGPNATEARPPSSSVAVVQTQLQSGLVSNNHQLIPRSASFATSPARQPLAQAAINPVQLTQRPAQIVAARQPTPIFTHGSPQPRHAHMPAIQQQQAAGPILWQQRSSMSVRQHLQGQPLTQQQPQMAMHFASPSNQPRFVLSQQMAASATSQGIGPRGMMPLIYNYLPHWQR